jgi:hypothetical protein
VSERGEARERAADRREELEWEAARYLRQRDRLVRIVREHDCDDCRKAAEAVLDGDSPDAVEEELARVLSEVRKLRDFRRRLDEIAPPKQEGSD